MKIYFIKSIHNVKISLKSTKFKPTTAPQHVRATTTRHHETPPQKISPSKPRPATACACLFSEFESPFLAFSFSGRVCRQPASR